MISEEWLYIYVTEVGKMAKFKGVKNLCTQKGT